MLRMMAARAAGCLVVLSTAGCGVVAVARTGQAPGIAANKAAAREAAANALQKVVLPAGAARTETSPWRGSVAGALASLHLIDIHQDWRVPGAPRRVLGWIKAHPPAGSTVFSTGSDGRYGKTSSWFVTFALPPAPGVYQQGVGIGVMAAKGGGSAVRADGWAIWLIPRPHSEQVPPGVRAVAVFADVVAGRAFPVNTVTAPRTIARLVSYVNSLAITQAISMSCPSYAPGWALLGLRFLPASTSAPQVRVADDGCFGLRFTLGKRSGPPLMETVDLASKLWQLGVLPVCTSQQLRASSTLPARLPAPPALDMSLNFRNGSSTVCSLNGFARLRLLSPRGRPLPTRVMPGLGTPEVTILAPGAAAALAVLWPVRRHGCNAPRVGSVNVSLPRVSQAIPVKVGSATRPVAPCGGKIRVEAIARSWPGTAHPRAALASPLPPAARPAARRPRAG